MKWVKHMTASWDDEKMASLVGEGGDSGLAMYGAYWRIAEIVAAQMDGAAPNCAVAYPVWRWAQKLSVRKSYLTSILVRLQKARLLVYEQATNDDRTITVFMPNLLKYRDEYSRKSGVSPDNVTPRTDTEGEGEQKQKEKVLFAPSANAITSSSIADIKPVVEDPNEITDPSLAARIVLDGCSLSQSRKFFSAVADQARLAKAAGENLRVWTEKLIAAYLEYQNLHDKLAYPCGTELFFSDRVYLKRGKWKLKGGGEQEGNTKFWTPEETQ